jgi:hypothetical protein
MPRLHHGHANDPCAGDPFAGDPFAGLGWRQRRVWRRTESAIVSGHQHEMAASLRRLIGMPVQDLRTWPAGSVSLTLPDWIVGLAEVGTRPGDALISLARRPCHLARTGRYGPFWWLEVASDADPAGSRAVVLGTRVRLHRRTGDGDHPRPPGLTPLDTRKEYSLP